MNPELEQLIESLDTAIQVAHRRWIKAQTKFPTLPLEA